MKKKVLILLFLSILILPYTTFAIVKRSTNKYVTDEAKILSEETEDYMVKYSDFIYKQKKIDYYVVTVKSLEDLTIEEYAEEVYTTFKIRDRGLLILFTTDERKIRIIAGEKLTDIIDSDLIDEYIDTYFIPYLEREKWNEGFINGYNAFYKLICEHYDIDASDMEVVEELDFVTKYKTPMIFVIVWASVMASTVLAKYIKKTKKYGKVNYFETLKVMIAVITNIFLLAFSYILEPIYLLFVIGFEGITLYSNLYTPTQPNIPIVEEEKEKPKKKERKTQKPQREKKESKKNNKYYKNKRTEEKKRKKKKEENKTIF